MSGRLPRHLRVPFAEQQLVEALVPKEPPREERARGNGGEQRALGIQERVLVVGRLHHRLAIEVAHSAQHVAEGCLAEPDLSLAEALLLQAKGPLEPGVKLSFPPLQLLRHGDPDQLVGSTVEAGRFKQNLDLERGLYGYLVDQEVALLPGVVRILLGLLVWRLVAVNRNVMPLFTRGGAVDKPPREAVLNNVRQPLQAWSNSLKVVVAEKKEGKSGYIYYCCSLKLSLQQKHSQKNRGWPRI